MKNVDIIYNIIDLSEEYRRKHLLEDETKDGLISFISEELEKPLFRLFIREDEKSILEDKMNKFKFYDYSPEEEYKLGDFLLCLEELGDL